MKMRFKVIVLRLLMAILLELVDARRCTTNLNLGDNLEKHLIEDAYKTINELEADENVY